MKILSANQIREADQYTIKHEPITSIDLMERASRAFSLWFLNTFSRQYKVQLFCGIGNNGGDGMAIARILTGYGYRVELFTLGFSGNGSDDFLKNRRRVSDILECQNIEHVAEFPTAGQGHIIVDALFGSGLNRPLRGLAAQLVIHLNQQNAQAKVAVDISSGLMADQPSTGIVFRASHTLSFQLPKLAFFAPENDIFVGHWHLTDIGLHSTFINETATKNQYFTAIKAASIYKHRAKYSHKGSYGHLLLAAGSRGKTGAAVMAAKAALRSGVGLITVQLPACVSNLMHNSIAEAMVSSDQKEYCLSHIPIDPKYQAYAIGPGMGTAIASQKALETFLRACKSPVVLDADALNILAEKRELLEILPAQCILTPHPKEFERLFGPSTNSFERWALQDAMAKRYDIVILLKGAHSRLTDSGGKAWFNSSGNPGMATGGSGDVLTGIIGSLLAQGYQLQDAALLGMWLHGYAADLAVEKQNTASLIPSDVIESLKSVH